MIKFIKTPVLSVLLCLSFSTQVQANIFDSSDENKKTIPPHLKQLFDDKQVFSVQEFKSNKVFNQVLISNETIQTTENISQAILNRVEKWRKAWEDQDVKSYLRFYKEGFRPQNGLTHEGWVKTRERNITRPVFIDITLTEVEVSLMSPREVKVSFIQNYTSNTFESTVKKVLLFKIDSKSDPSDIKNWLISQETVIGTL